MTTVAERRAERTERESRRQTRQAFEDRIYSALPQTISAPTISNESNEAFFGKPGAWVSFHREYGSEMKGSEFLAALEAAGFKALPASLVKWDNYRRTAEPGTCESLPEEKGRYKLTECESIAPLWIEPNQHAGTEAECYMEAPDGLILKISVPGPNRCRIYAKRKKSLGDWHYERNSARLDFPQEWHTLVDAEGSPITQISRHSHAYVDTEKGISGRLYFEPIAHEQDEFPLTQSALLKQLEDAHTCYRDNQNRCHTCGKSMGGK